MPAPINHAYKHTAERLRELEEKAKRLEQIIMTLAPDHARLVGRVVELERANKEKQTDAK